MPRTRFFLRRLASAHNLRLPHPIPIASRFPLDNTSLLFYKQTAEHSAQHMTSDNYKLALQQAQQELARAISERDRWTLEVFRLQSLAKNLAIGAMKTAKAEKFAEEMSHQLGLSPAIESVLNQSGKQFSPIEVRDALIATGYDLQHYSNPLSLIHQTLHRLAAEGKIREINGKFARPEWMDAVLRSLFGS